MAESNATWWDDDEFEDWEDNEDEVVDIDERSIEEQLDDMTEAEIDEWMIRRIESGESIGAQR